MRLPDWLHPLLDAGEQRALDEWAIGERGIAGLELVERAGAGIAELVSVRVPARQPFDPARSKARRRS
jgi:NAD(P)H-hydrate repair Nnr-like enzyme with NAD(P)H-hydrate epimerase domain